jgi:rhodanese-related sulfurtransferase
VIVREGVGVSTSISFSELRQRQGGARAPLIFDVRRKAAFLDAECTIAGALRREPEHVRAWSSELPRSASVVVYCVHGHQVSQDAAQALRDCGLEARYLDHGFEGWQAEGGPVWPKPARSATAWVTRERPKIDRIACPWLIARFVDADATFLYVPPGEVEAVARRERAQPYDVANATLGHVGECCSFDAALAHFNLQRDPALSRLAAIVRGADTGRPELAPECAGLSAISLGLSRLYADDHEMLARAMGVYDALYRCCQEGCDARDTWHPRIERGEAMETLR